MSNIAFRDSSIVIIETSRTIVRAGIGIHDLLKTPSFEIPARVGIRVSPTPVENTKPFLDITAPSASTSRAPSAFPQPATVKVTDYLVGTQLDEALATGQDITVSWPFANGKINDWTQAEALWKHTLFTGLGLRRVQNESPVLLCLPLRLSRDSYERACQLFFERFNVAAFSILDRATAQLYAANSLTGVVVDIGESVTDITPIYDGLPVPPAYATIRCGTAACEAHLATLLRTNTSVTQALAGLSIPDSELDSTLRELARAVWKAGLVKVPSDSTGVRPDAEDEGVTDIAAVVVAGKEKAVIESGMKRKATQKASAAEQARAREIEALDLVPLQFRGVEVTLGRERHRFCEPLFDISLLGPNNGKNEDGLLLPVHTAVGHAVGLLEVDQRQYVYNGLFVTGDVTSHVKGIGVALQTNLSAYVLSTPDQQNDVQPRHIRVLKVPDYFAEFREKGDGLAAFLGSTIVAKITFHDGKNFVSKTDYSERGPKAVLDNSPSLL